MLVRILVSSLKAKALCKSVGWVWVWRVEILYL